MHVLHRILVTAAIALLPLAGCTSGTEPVTAIPDHAIRVARTPLLTGEAERFRTYTSMARERIAVRDQASLEAVWRMMSGTMQPGPPVPTVDFTSETVIIASMGGHPNLGAWIEIEAVAAADGVLYVVVQELVAGTGCVTLSAVSNPTDGVRIPRHDAKVVFIDRRVTYECLT